MPVLVDSKEIHPFLPSLGSPLAIERRRAERQDIRPLEIAIINLMADKISTERQLALWLGNTTLQVNLSFIATDSYVRRIQFMAAYREHLHQLGQDRLRDDALRHRRYSMDRSVRQGRTRTRNVGVRAAALTARDSPADN